MLLAFLPYMQRPGMTYQLASLFILVILASMWNLLAGYAGLVSIGLQGFIGYRVDVTAPVSTEPPERVGHE